MNDQSQGNRNPNQRRHNNRRRHHHNKTNAGAAGNNQTPQNQSSEQSKSNGPRRRFHNKPHFNRGRNPNRDQQFGNQPQINLDRIYEKYLNLLDQHLIARRKYHDLFFRADPAQKSKLEKNFYQTINDVRDFENKLAPDVKILFEKRNNGLGLDLIYTQNHNLTEEIPLILEEDKWEDPHLLQSQIKADYSNDNEESVGTIDDYLRYKGSH